MPFWYRFCCAATVVLTQVGTAFKVSNESWGFISFVCVTHCKVFFQHPYKVVVSLGSCGGGGSPPAVANSWQLLLVMLC